MHRWFDCFLIMRQLGEMIVEEPVAGSFSHLLINIGVNFQAFIRLELLGSIYPCCDRELTAGCKIHQLLVASYCCLAIVLFFFVIITAINLTNVKFYGGIKFWLAIIKVTAVVAMIFHLVCSTFHCQMRIQQLI